MADEETPETTEDETPAAEAPEAEAPAAEQTPASADVDDEADRPAGDVNPPAPALSRAQERAAKRHADASKRQSRTPEERQAEREERRRKLAAQRRRRRAKEKAKRAERPKATPPEPVAHTEGRPKVRLGRVVSDKADKTITVRIDNARRHRRYEKVVRSTSTLHAHDENNDANEGDLVRVVEARPLSRTKRWRLIEVLERAR
jgi:small subunit ribosomal protein S17